MTCRSLDNDTGRSARLSSTGLTPALQNILRTVTIPCRGASRLPRSRLQDRYVLPGGDPMTNDPKRSSKRDLAPRYSDPFSALRAEDSLFDSFIGGLPTFSGMFGSSGGRGFALSPTGRNGDRQGDRGGSRTSGD